MLYSKIHIPYVSSRGAKNFDVERNIQFLRAVLESLRKVIRFKQNENEEEMVLCIRRNNKKLISFF